MLEQAKTLSYYEESVMFLCYKPLKWPTHSLSNWDFAESIFLASKAGQGVLNKDSTVWMDGARPPPLVLLVLPLTENEFGKVII